MFRKLRKSMLGKLKPEGWKSNFEPYRGMGKNDQYCSFGKKIRKERGKWQSIKVLV